MRNSDTAESAITDEGRTRPVVEFSGAVTLILSEEIEHVILDGELIDHRLWELAGAFDGSELTVTLEDTLTVWGTVEAFVLTVRHDVLLEKPMIRKIIHVDGEDKISVLDNVEFYLRKDYRGQGIGRASLSVEAVAAYELGFSKIVAVAANRPDEGWIVWPRLGYDAEIDDDILAKMQEDLKKAGFVSPNGRPRISDLLEQGLYELWDRHGDGCIMEFDVSASDTWSMSVLMGTNNSQEH